MALTADEANNISSAFLEAANEIDNYLDTNYQVIKRSEYEIINENFKTLLRAASFINTVAVGLALDELQSPATTLLQVISHTKEEISKLQNVGRVIRFIAGLTDLAASIMAKDPNAVIKSTTALITLIQDSRELVQHVNG